MALGDPDKDLAPEQFAARNREFYNGARPSAYLTRRLRLLMLSLGRADDLATLLAEGVDFGPLTFRVDGEPSDEEDEERRHFASTETLVLVHHSTEAFLRLLIAHEAVPACPWIELARLWKPGDFKGRIAALRHGPSDEAERRRFAEVLLGGVLPPDGSTDDESLSVWSAGIDTAMRFIALSADRLLQEAPTYNAAKHGLAVVSTTGSLFLGSKDDPFPLDISTGEGPLLTSIGFQRQTSTEPARWVKTSTWIRIQEDVIFVWLTLRMMDNLWAVARARYLGMAPFSVTTISEEMLEKALFKRPDTPYLISGISEPLLYYVPEEEL